MSEVHTEIEPGLVQVPGWNEIPWLRHGFSTRRGGVSTVYLPQDFQEQNGHLGFAREGELNLGLTKDDHPEFVAENRRRLVAAITGSATTPLITICQVHSSTSLIVAAPFSHTATGLLSSEGHAIRQGDGLLTNAHGVLLGIQTADCVPVLVADTAKRVVATFHAGWRGTVARIVEHGVRRMVAEYGSRPEDMIAAIGPSIGACCYTVGEQVRTEFMEAFSYAEALFHERGALVSAKATGSSASVHGGSRKAALYLDLWEANRRQLLDAGVAQDQIAMIGECTSCTGLDGNRKWDDSDGRRYFSHRCDHGFTGRMMNVIGIFDEPRG